GGRRRTARRRARRRRGRDPPAGRRQRCRGGHRRADRRVRGRPRPRGLGAAGRRHGRAGEPAGGGERGKPHARGDRRGGAGRAAPPGSLDAGFGEGGIASLPLVDGQVLVRGIALDREGRLLVAGTLSTPAGLEIALVRLTAGGQPDAELAAGGAIRTSLGGEEPRATAVVAAADGTLLAARPTSEGDD